MIEEVERAIRERGVRVEERLALLRQLTGDAGAARIREQIDERMSAVRRAADRVRGELS